MDNKIYTSISNEINTALDEYHKLEGVFKDGLSTHKMVYRYGNERPIAAFMNDKILAKLKDQFRGSSETELHLMNELPLAGGKDKEFIKEIQKKFLKDAEITKILTKYKHYDIDGTIIIKEGSKITPVFLEYKTETTFNNIRRF